jgi:hypothetical protein
VPNRPPVGPVGPPIGPVGPPGQQTEAIAGGAATDPQFTDLVPAQAKLVGFEVALGEDGMNPTVRAVRPIYRANDKQTLGEWQGVKKDAKELVKVVAKTGYAVGAITVKPGTNVAGFMVKFMKIAGDKLDPNDSYESEWIGTKDGPGPAPTTLGGKSDPPRGVLGRTNATGVTGLGLLSSDNEKKQPDRPPIGVVPPPPNKAGERGPRIHGGGGDPESRDVAPAGGLLVGFEVGLGKFVNNDIIGAIRPIYRVGDKESDGELYGTDMKRAVKVIAKPGYAVGSISVKTGLGVDGFSITFMKVTDGKLDPKDSYESEWIGGPGGFTLVRIGDGTPVVGILIKNNPRTVSGMGLIYTDTNKPELDGAWPKGTPSRIQGGGGDREFREAGPDGALLVGMEVGVGRFFDHKVIKSMRPIFRNGDKETLGAWHGPTDQETVKEVVKVVAKPGYAVGAVTAKTGLGMNGFSVTFMKIVNGRLDPTDKYESEWIGTTTGGEGKIGDGTPVIGLIGKSSAASLSGLGLLFPAKK